MTASDCSSLASSVCDLAAHFESLKQRATDLSGTLTASKRGYFQPGEEEEVSHLLVSYWKARAALFDVIATFRDDEETYERPDAFLVAFTAALVLVDAARFLRESFANRPVVRRKLNEANPVFDIPAGVYDSVQKSLTAPGNALELHRATSHFDKSLDAIRSATEGTELRSLLEVASRLVDRTRVSIASYAKARAGVRARQAATGLRTTVLGGLLFALERLAGELSARFSLRPSHRPGLPPDATRRLGAVLEPGDVLVTRKEHLITNYFLPGWWPHAALYLGKVSELEALGVHETEAGRPRWDHIQKLDEDPRRVLESMKDGVLVRPISSPLSVDSLVILRPRLTRPDLVSALPRALAHEGKRYDFDFDFTRSDRLVCTEVIYRTYDGIGDLRFELVRRAGRMTFSATDLLEMAIVGRGFDTVAVFIPGDAARVQLGDEAARTVRERLGS